MKSFREFDIVDWAFTLLIVCGFMVMIPTIIQVWINLFTGGCP